MTAPLCLTARERHFETLLFGTPDRIPFQPGGPRKSTREAWHKQGLPEGADWFQVLCQTIGVTIQATKPQAHPGVSLRMHPMF